MRLKCVKPLMYATRRFLPGDVFDSKTERDGRVLLATKKVKLAPEGRTPGKIAPPSSKVKEQIKNSTGSAQPTQQPKTEEHPANHVGIPHDWEGLHWTQQVKIAEAIAGHELVADEKGTKASKAAEVIKAEVERRGAAAKSE